jgi:hypothetical protein
MSHTFFRLLRASYNNYKCKKNACSCLNCLQDINTLERALDFCFQKKIQLTTVHLQSQFISMNTQDIFQILA